MLEKQPEDQFPKLKDARLLYTDKSITLKDTVPSDEGLYSFYIHPYNGTFQEVSVVIRPVQGKLIKHALMAVLVLPCFMM